MAKVDSFETIKLEQVSDYFVLILNRPESLNSINQLMHKELKAAINIIVKSKPRALLLTASGKGFCAGQDLNERNISSETKPDLGESLESRYNPLIKSLCQLPFPTVCAVNGVAAGAGVSLALSCDFVLASDDANFIQAFSKIGLVPDSSATWLLPKLIGTARAKAAMMLGLKLSASQALDWGMIWQTYPADKLHSSAIDLIEDLAKMPTKSLNMIKVALAESWNNNINQQLDLERDLQSFCGNTKDYQEGVSAFLAKRPAKFTGE